MKTTNLMEQSTLQAEINSATKFSQKFLNDFFNGIYTNEELNELITASVEMWNSSKSDCKIKSVGGMEEWAKNQEAFKGKNDFTCDWYHGFWQFFRLLNMVAVPKWYPFYTDAIATALVANPNAKVFISACADYGMLAQLHEAIKKTKSNPSITIYDICRTPLISSTWYASRHNLKIDCYADNILTADIKENSYDLIITDEFLSVLKSDYKPTITQVWKKILKPGGRVVTTAMVGTTTTQERRDYFSAKARMLVTEHADKLFPTFVADNNLEELIKGLEKFAAVHTRHMLTGEEELRNLFKDFKNLSYNMITTPGECVNPTDSFQIVAIAK